MHFWSWREMLGCQMPGYGAQTMKAQGLEKKSSGVNVKPSTSVPAVVCMQPVSVQDSKFSMGNLLYFLGLFFFSTFLSFFLHTACRFIDAGWTHSTLSKSGIERSFLQNATFWTIVLSFESVSCRHPAYLDHNKPSQLLCSQVYWNKNRDLASAG